LKIQQVINLEKKRYICMCETKHFSNRDSDWYWERT